MSDNYLSTEAVWSATSQPPSGYPPLSGDVRADVVIIGAGITGLSTAYNLLRSGKSVIIVDSGKVGMGTTGSSTGNLYVPTAEFRSILSKHGRDGLNAVIGARQAALNFVADRINQYGLDCGFCWVPWYYFTPFNTEAGEIEKEAEAMRTGGLVVNDYAPESFPFRTKAVAAVESQAQINPLEYARKFAAAISSDKCRIFENTRVLDIHDGAPCVAETARGIIKADRVVQATHTPKGVYAVHALMEVYREYALAARLPAKLPWSGILWSLEGKEKYSIRTYNKATESYLIVLDDKHKVGHKERTEASFEKIEHYLRFRFNIDKITYLWAAQNYKPADELPYIGTSPAQKNIYIATGFAADGLIWGTAAGMIISDLINGISNPWAKTFDPKRFTPLASAKRAVEENVTVVSHLIKDYIFKGTEKELAAVRNGEGKIVEFNNEKAAAYRDNTGNMYVVSAKCPHMGCILHWNSAERSWDCPCHGSRYSFDGSFLEGPAIKDLERYTESHD